MPTPTRGRIQMKATAPEAMTTMTPRIARVISDMSASARASVENPSLLPGRRERSAQSEAVAPGGHAQGHRS